MTRVLPVVVRIAETHDALMTLYRNRFGERTEPAEREAILKAWGSG